ncbi:MAG TPA: hypothetical protein VGB17_14065 [Pyrinomonadaceae bacterium]|jgi:hypothetical protein
MKIQTARQYVFSAALIATFLLGAVSALAQERKIPMGEEVALPVKGGCPKPIALTLNATTPNVINTDFNAVQLAAPRAVLNDPLSDKSFLYSFRWISEQRCCEITKAVLTVKLKANQPGQSKTSSDAGNDGIAIMHAGSVVLPFSEPVYSSWPFSVGQTATKTWNLTGAALSNLNSTGTLSLYVQDDTSVVSATLQIYGCCLSSK